MSLKDSRDNGAQAELFAVGMSPDMPPVFNVSPWVAMSALQKAIRRNQPDIALRAASTLFQSEPQRLWRRLAGICFEDIGLGNLDLVSRIMAEIGALDRRRIYGDDWSAAAAFVISMCSAVKDRSADDLYITALHHPSLGSARREISLATVETRLPRIAEPSALLTKAMAITSLVEQKRNRKATCQNAYVGIPAIWDAICSSGCPDTVVAVCKSGYAKTQETLPMMIALLAAHPRSDHRNENGQLKWRDDDFPGDPELPENGVPLYAYDMFSREGHAALDAFLNTDTQTARLIRNHFPPMKRRKVLGGLLFRVESGLVAKRRQNQLAIRLRDLADEGFVDHSTVLMREAVEYLRSDLSALARIRYGQVAGTGARSS